MTLSEIQMTLGGYDPETLAIWWGTLNQWQWPADMPIAKPVGYDSAPRRCTRLGVVDKYALQAAVFSILTELTTEEERSRAWWLHGLKRTQTEWEAWWDSMDSRDEGKERGHE